MSITQKMKSWYNGERKVVADETSFDSDRRLAWTSWLALHADDQAIQSHP
jgi:hypothetical protein